MTASYPAGDWRRGRVMPGDVGRRLSAQEIAAIAAALRRLNGDPS